MSGKYDDIIDLPHHVSSVHPRMSRHDRAAQFSPFAALTGYEDVIRESARLTTPRRETDEQRKSCIDANLRYISENIDNSPNVSIEYYAADASKDGGSYEIHSGSIRKVDYYSQRLIFSDGTEIEFKDIWNFTETDYEQNF